ncbi:MAG TPA: DUF2510 domain-containing protein [Acidimicrobiales bacterium]|nr:DUF2510 domain-containing protein [Acidimicrobiales bacterium]
MAVRGAVRLAGAAAIALLIGLTGPGAGAQEDPAAPAESTTPTEPTTAAPPSIREALAGTSKAVTGSAAGGFGSDDTLDVVLTLENHTDAPVQLAVPRGALFATEDEGEQTAVTVGPIDEVAATVRPGVDPTITIEPGEHQIELAGFCAQHLDSGPAEVVPMTWAGVAEEPLTTVLTTIAATEPDPIAAQHAVWWVTDVPVLPVPAEVEPLLDGVDTEAFAANPKRVVPDERYTPAWGRDQALDPDDPFGDTPFSFDDPTGDDGAFSTSGGDDGSPGMGLFLLGAVAACGVITILVARSASRKAPALVRSNDGATPPGWHPDPQQSQQLRYWDGSTWTNDTRPF